ncbi:MAG TPA: hypothetical protein VFV81_09645 [Verrucomicrobiae bacterium]|nr:hypothetical protein [Verrucomicrobiae bacterium]
MALSNFSMKLFFSLLALGLALTLTGCVTKAKAQAMARQAYLDGQRSAFASMRSEKNIAVLGDVDNHQVPWVDGLTLAQAIATARYNGLHDPKLITINRNGETGQVNPRDLLHGRDIPLEPGDIITVSEH